MTDEARQLVSALHAWHKVMRKRVVMSGHADSKAIDTADELRRAADMIEKLSADLDSDERQYRRDTFETLVTEGVKLEAERDEWERRCKAAEHDIETLLMEGCAGCDFCAYFESCSRSEIQSTYCNPKWRGLCDGNKGR